MGICSSRDSLSKGNWADVPIDILDKEILSKLGDVEDLVRFGAVCSSWRCASLENKNTNNKTSFFPCLMLFESGQEQESNKKDVRKIINLSTNKTIELYLPEAQGRRSLGSSFGWILTVGSDINMHLFNPLTRLQISLPPEPTFRYVDPTEDESESEGDYEDKEDEEEEEREYLRTGSSSSATVMVVCGKDRTLALARPGDRAWTYVRSTRTWFDDVIFFDNHFYAVQHGGHVVVVSDITTPVPVAKDFMPSPFPITHSISYYLVEMSGHLHMVVRLHGTVCSASIFTLQFRVYRLDFDLKQWIELQDLGDHAMFIGNNASFAIHHPQLSSNCIYFTDDHTEFRSYGTCDMGLFDFSEKKIVGPIYSDDCIHSTLCSDSLFFIPDLQ